MFKMIFAMFIMYQLSSGNRLLLQGGIPSVPAPPQPPPAPQQPGVPQQPAAPQPPAAPVTPQQPVAPPAAPQQPGAGQPPAAPAPAVPQQPVAPPPTAPINPWQLPQSIQQQTMKAQNMMDCSLPSGVFGSCSQTAIPVRNPQDGFGVECSGAPMSCYQSTINLIIEPLINGGMPLTTIKGFFATSDYAMYGATVNMFNARSEQIYIEKIMCDGLYSCTFATFILGENMVIEQGAVFCPGIGSCDGCVIKQSIFDVGEPCSKYAEQV